MNSWKPIIRENLQTRPELENIMDKYAAAFLKNTQLVEHLTKGKFGRYAKTIFYSLPVNQSNSTVVTVKGKRTNYGDGQGLQIPSTIKLKGEAKCVKILQEQLNLYL